MRPDQPSFTVDFGVSEKEKGCLKNKSFSFLGGAFRQVRRLDSKGSSRVIPQELGAIDGESVLGGGGNKRGSLWGKFFSNINFSKSTRLQGKPPAAPPASLASPGKN